MKIIVTGGRDFAQPELLWATLDRYHPLMVIHGAAVGADTFADAWAKTRGAVPIAYPCTPEMWRACGNDAGNMRNRQMLIAHRDAIVLAFPGPKSRGTWNCMRDACAGGMRVDLCAADGSLTCGWRP